MNTIQQERLKKVFDYLKERGTTQREIAIQTGETESNLSRLKSGTTKISPNFINELEKAYAINPSYIFGDSERMLHYRIQKLNYLDQVVEKWGTVESATTKQKYLHLFMDKNLYDFLIDVDKVRMAVADGISSEFEELKSLEELYTAKPNVQEFVVLPRDIFIEILTDTEEHRPQLEEVIDLWGHSGYLETEETCESDILKENK